MCRIRESLTTHIKRFQLFVKEVTMCWENIGHKCEQQQQQRRKEEEGKNELPYFYQAKNGCWKQMKRHVSNSSFFFNLHTYLQ